MYKYLIVFSLVLLTISAVVAQEEIKEYKNPLNLGVIFNIGESIFSLESYQGGLGFKLGRNAIDARFLTNFYYSNSLSSLSIDLNSSVEYHLNDATVSPYLGGNLGIGHISQKEKYGVGETWTAIKDLILYGGPLFGVEIFVLDFLSLFAEYSFRIEHHKNTIQDNTPDKLITKETKILVLNTGLGNNANIGLVVYFKRNDSGRGIIQKLTQ